MTIPDATYHGNENIAIKYQIAERIKTRDTIIKIIATVKNNQNSLSFIKSL